MNRRGATAALAALAVLTAGAALPVRAAGDEKTLTIELGKYEDDAEGAIWLAYALGLANWATSSGALDAAPVGPLVPTFDGELAARSLLITIWRESQASKAAKPSAYMDALLRVQDAGFLREYVWTVHWRSSWKDQPADLRLAAFYAWQRSALAGHQPQTRSQVRVVLGTPAAEPPASAASR